MNLSKFTDYAFRSLIYLGKNQNRLCTVQELANYLNVSENHIKKIIHNLAKKNYILSIKGRTGGIKLATLPKNINLGDVLIYCEDFSKVVECQKDNINCIYNSEKCLIKDIVKVSTNKFIDEFKKYTLEDVLFLHKY